MGTILVLAFGVTFAIAITVGIAFSTARSGLIGRMFLSALFMSCLIIGFFHPKANNFDKAVFVALALLYAYCVVKFARIAKPNPGGAQ